MTFAGGCSCVQVYHNTGDECTSNHTETVCSTVHTLVSPWHSWVSHTDNGCVCQYVSCQAYLSPPKSKPHKVLSFVGWDYRIGSTNVNLFIAILIWLNCPGTDRNTGSVSHLIRHSGRQGQRTSITDASPCTCALWKEASWCHLNVLTKMQTLLMTDPIAVLNKILYEKNIRFLYNHYWNHQHNHFHNT